MHIEAKITHITDLLHCMNITQTCHFTHDMGREIKSHLHDDPYFSVWIFPIILPPTPKKNLALRFV